jgi:glycopeptide antibiotics resistance protein
MDKRRIAGALWLVAAAFAIAITIIFRIDPVQWAVTFAFGVVAAVVGMLLIARPSALVLSASNVLAVAWILLYAVLTVQQSDELAAWITDVALLVSGAVAGLVAYRAARSATVTADGSA